MVSGNFLRCFKKLSSCTVPLNNWVRYLSVENFCGPFTREPMNTNLSKEPQRMTAEEAVSFIKSGDKVYVHGTASTPIHLTTALAEHAKKNQLKNVRCYHIHTEGKPIITDPSCYDIIRSTSFFTSSNARKAINEGKADFIPIFLSEIPHMFRRNFIPLDCALIHVSPPDKHGYCTLGPSVEATRSAVQTAKKIIAVQNERMPRCFGHGIIHQSNIDVMVTHNCELPVLHPKKPTEEDIKIGEIIASNLVEDSSTLQMGIGSIPDCVLSFLGNHRGLGVHTEMISDGIIDLCLKGVINNSNKKVNPGKTVSSFALGTRRLYDFLDDNIDIVMADVGYTNDINIIGMNPKVVAINSCIEIDITGQVVSDSIGTRIYSGVGGQIDFVSGANRAVDKKGKSILAMHSTTSRGESKIVPFIKEGSAVCTTRAHVRYVVTEYGVAYLFGKDLRQRAYELIKIAHPNHRQALEKAAFDRLKVMPSP